MKRATTTVLKEMAEAHKQLTADPYEQIVTGNMLARWMLLLSPARVHRVHHLTPPKSRVTRKHLDSLCRQIIFQRDGSKCRKCGRTDRQLQWCHVYPKGANPWLRWDLDNSFCGCAHCHLNWWHGRPKEAMEWWEKELGPERWKALVLRAAKPRKSEPKLVMIYLKQQLSRHLPQRTKV